MTQKRLTVQQFERTNLVLSFEIYILWVQTFKKLSKQLVIPFNENSQNNIFAKNPNKKI